MLCPSSMTVGGVSEDLGTSGSLEESGGELASVLSVDSDISPGDSCARGFSWTAEGAVSPWDLCSKGELGSLGSTEFEGRWSSFFELNRVVLCKKSITGFHPGETLFDALILDAGRLPFAIFIERKGTSAPLSRERTCRCLEEEIISLTLKISPISRQTPAILNKANKKKSLQIHFPELLARCMSSREDGANSGDRLSSRKFGDFVGETA